MAQDVRLPLASPVLPAISTRHFFCYSGTRKGDRTLSPCAHDLRGPPTAHSLQWKPLFAQSPQSEDKSVSLGRSVAPPGRLPRSSHPIRGEGLDTRTAWLTPISRRGAVTNSVAVLLQTSHTGATERPTAARPRCRGIRLRGSGELVDPTQHQELQGTLPRLASQVKRG